MALSTLALCALLAACDTADLAAPESAAFDASALAVGDVTVDLLAGQTTKVGTVSVTLTSGGYQVVYSTYPGICIREWHLHAAPTVAGFPQNPGGPIPGRFKYKGKTGAGCVTTVTRTVPVGEGPFFAAHAFVSGDGSGAGGYLFAIQRTDGKIFKVSLGDLADPGDNSAELFFTPSIAPPSNSNWPNGLALAAVSGRLYFTNNTRLNDVPANNPLYFVDLATNTQVLAGNLQQRSASAVGIGGSYYYIPQNSADRLRRVDFNANGTVAGETVVCNRFLGTAGDTRMFFGDLAYSPTTGLIYGSARIGADAAANSTFFSLHPETCAYQEIRKGPSLPLMQLAFDCSGTLIGHDTDSRQFYTVDPATGSVAAVGTTGQAFNDLAEGVCTTFTGTETAWGAGPRFRERGNWATYFQYVTPGS